MRAAVVTEFGSPEVLQTTEVPDPVPGHGEVMIGVAAADVLWLEAAMRREPNPYFEATPPYIPGDAVAGTVRSVGDGVEPHWLGKAVVVHTGMRGGYAELVAVAADKLSAVPEGLSLTAAAALLHDAVTAIVLDERLAITGDDTVLVVGASGGLGIVSVQLAIARGARVVAVARDERKLSRIRDLGADAVIDSERPGWVEEARAALGDKGATVVLDNIGGAVGEAAFDVVARGGRFSAHGTPSGRFAAIDPDEAQRRGVTLSGILDVQLSDAELVWFTEKALAEAAAGTISPVIGQTFPLEKAADAHAAIEDRAVFGKTLLLVS